LDFPGVVDFRLLGPAIPPEIKLACWTESNVLTMGRADESRAGIIATAIILSPSIALVTVALRSYTRMFLVGVKFFEDYCIICAMAFSIIMSIFMGICK